MSLRWTWEEATWRERADAIRQHDRQLGRRDDLRRLFRLTPEGLIAIIDGADWKPEFEDSTP